MFVAKSMRRLSLLLPMMSNPLKSTLSRGLRKSVKSHVPESVFPNIIEDYAAFVPPSSTRFDDTHYKPSDKYQRTYMQTWVDYPKRTIVPKKNIFLEPTADLPPIERRVPKQAAQGVPDRKIVPAARDLMSSKQFPKFRSLRLLLEGFAPPLPRNAPLANVPLANALNQSSSTKRACPQPAYSECERTKPTRWRIEVRSMNGPTFCPPGSIRQRNLGF